MVRGAERGNGVDLGGLVGQSLERNRPPAAPVVEVAESGRPDEVVHERAGAGRHARRGQVESARASASGAGASRGGASGAGAFSAGASGAGASGAGASGAGASGAGASGARSFRPHPFEARVHLGDHGLAAGGDAEFRCRLANAVADRGDVRRVVELQDRHTGAFEERLRARPASIGPDHQVGPQGKDILGPRPDRRQAGRRRPQVGERLAGIRRQGQDAAALGESQHVLVRAVVQAHDAPGRSVPCLGWRGRRTGGGEDRYRPGHESRRAR